MAKVAINWNDLVKGSSTRQKLPNSKSYTESPEFSPALGLIIFRKKSVATSLRYIRSLVRSITIFFVHTYIAIRTPTRLHYPARLRVRVIKYVVHGLGWVLDSELAKYKKVMKFLVWFMKEIEQKKLRKSKYFS